MHIITTKENLASPLVLVAGAADTRGTIPILNTVLLKTNDTGHLSMICSDTGVLAKAMTPVEVKQGGEIAVDVRRINELVRALPEKQPIEIALDKTPDVLLVKAGRSRFRLPALSASDYPRMMPAKEQRVTLNIAASRLGEMIADAIPSMADGDVRTYLNGTLFALDKDGLFIVSTDGNRLTVGFEALAGCDKLTPRNVIIPRKTLLLAKKLLAQGGAVALTLGEKNVQFSFADNTTLFGNAIEGQFPAWKGVIPDAKERVTIDAAKLSSSLAMLAATDDKTQKKSAQDRVDMCITHTTTTIKRGESGVCELDSSSTSNVEHKQSFNINYLTEAVATIRSSSPEVVIGYAPDGRAITMQPKDKQYPLVVIMQMRN